MIDPIATNYLGNIDSFPSSNFTSKTIETLKSYDYVSSDLLDSEAQEMFSMVNNDLNVNTNEATSVHNNLSYSRVMSLLEGL